MYLGKNKNVPNLIVYIFIPSKKTDNFNESGTTAEMNAKVAPNISVVRGPINK